MIDNNELTDLFDRLWWIYPTDLSGNKKGSKKLAKESLAKIYKKHGEPEINRIIENTEARARYDRKAKGQGETVYRWPFVSTYLNQGRYDDEIPSHSELDERHEAHFCECGVEAIIKDWCARCYTKFLGDKSAMPLDVLKDELKKLGLMKLQGETNAEWGRRCKEYAMQNHRSLARKFA